MRSIPILLSALKIILILVLCLLGMEAATRLHHYLRFGLLRPIYQQAVFYDSWMLEYSRSLGELKAVKPSSYQGEKIILSGGSVAWGFGGSRDTSPARRLAFHMNAEVFDLSFPGKNLQEEIEDLSRITGKPERVILMSGFNDLFGIQSITRLRQARTRVFFILPFLQYSLFFQKSFQRIFLLWERGNRDFSKSCDGIKARLRELKAKEKDFQITLFLQPILKPEKSLKGKEKAIVKQYSNHFYQGVENRRKELIAMLNQFSWIHMIDLQPVFDMAGQEIFLDICHLNQRGNSLLVTEMAQKIKPLR